MPKLLRVVLADDERPARRFLINLLKTFPDVEVVGEAASGTEAIDLIESEKPDLALLDLNMPEAGGLDVARLVKAEVAVAPVSDFKDLAEDPQMVARKVLATIDDPELGTLRMPDVLPRLSETPGRIRHAGLPMAVHNEEIYRERLGLSADEFDQLKADGII